MTIRTVLLIAIATFAPSMASALNLGDFTTCVSSSGIGSTCTLDANSAMGSYGVWDVTATIHIQRSNITIQGTVGDAGDIVLRRAASMSISSAIMYMDGALTNDLIQYFTFDGNRYNTTNCGGENPYYDVDFSSAGDVWVEYVNFINSPTNSLGLGSSAGVSGNASLIGYSNFGQGFYNATRNYYELGPPSAARFTAIFLSGYYTSAFSNSISYSGTAAINSFMGNNHLIYNNTLYQNRYEMSDGIPGGQLYINPSGPTDDIISENSVNGNGWYTTGASVNSCSTGYDLFNEGMEINNSGHYLGNNEVVDNTLYGISIGGSNITVSTLDPLFPGATPQLIYDNGECYYISSCGATPAGVLIDSSSNITLEDLYIQYNYDMGLSISYTTGSPGFVNTSPGYTCIADNGITNLISYMSSSGYNSYTNTKSPCP